MRKLIVFTLTLISFTVSAQVDVMKLRVAEQIQEYNLRIVPSRHADEIADQLREEYNIAGHDGIGKVMKARSSEGTTFNVGMDVFVMRSPTEISNSINNYPDAVFKRYDDIKRASVSVKQADDGTYIVLVASYL